MSISKTRFYQILGIHHFKQAHTADGSTITYKLTEPVTRKRKTETRAFADINGKEPLEPAPPLLDVPDIYTNGKKCSKCGKWRKATEFSPKRRNNGKVHLQSHCKFCRDEYAYNQYHGLNTRIS